VILVNILPSRARLVSFGPTLLQNYREGTRVEAFNRIEQQVRRPLFAARSTRLCRLLQCCDECGILFGQGTFAIAYRMATAPLTLSWSLPGQSDLDVTR
jgi:hypothetical protein